MNRRKFLVSSAAGLLLIATGATAVAAAPVQQVGTPGAGQAGWAQGASPRWQANAERPSAAVQKLLGMTAEQIQAERQAGKSLAQIAQAKGVSVESLISAITADHQAQVDQLVKDGKITQEQSNLMLERQQSQVKTAVERTTVGPMRAGAGFQTHGYGVQNGTATPRMGGGARLGAGLGPAFNR
ncbi:MAG: hypothetical protein ACYC4L_01650 [Chloroflexota bacterium]